MNKKLLFALPLLLVILCLLGPVIYKNNQDQNPVPVDAGGSAASLPATVPESPEETGNAGPALPATGNINSPSGNTEEVTPAPAPPAGSGKESPSSPVEPAKDKTVTVNIAVVGKDGELLFGPGQVEIPEYTQRGNTALGVLAATGLSYEVSKRYPDFVESIAGQRNKGQAGWLYKVNEEVPLVAANKKTVAAGDYVIWWYSSSINAPPPIWEELPGAH